MVPQLCIDAARLSLLAYSGHTWVWPGDVEALRGNLNGIDGFAARGTEPDEITDWLRDLRGFPVMANELGVRLHAGFWKAARRSWPDIQAELWPHREVVFTGHSMGAAIATIWAALAVRQGFRVKALVTFGSPRVGWSGLGRLLEGVPVFRYHRGGDMVPRHPWPVWGYSHVDQPIRLPGSGLPISDHAVDGYLEALLREAAD
ncbi:MAG: lipase family protein [Alphaproteobacteria bacterium]|nr:lipase family protein [Alphaproteobacteria bacterium]